MTPPWQFWIDVGGTFTDCIAVTPDGELRQFKTLSSGVTKGTIDDIRNDEFGDLRRTADPDHFWLGAELRLFSGRTIDVPSCFIAGASDWGVHQKPGAFDAMQKRVCTAMLGCHLIKGAGHWVQQEQPGEVSRLLLKFLDAAKKT